MTIKYIKERIKQYDKLVVVKGKQGKDTKSIAYWGDVDESKYNKPAVVTWELSEDESLYYSQAKNPYWYDNYFGGSY